MGEAQDHTPPEQIAREERAWRLVYLATVLLCVGFCWYAHHIAPQAAPVHTGCQCQCR